MCKHLDQESANKIMQIFQCVRATKNKRDELHEKNLII